MKTGLPKILVLLGPTASGKSDLAINLAKKFNGEIVNADSRSIYRGMLIGTASPFAQSAKKVSSFKFQASRIKHHLFHFVDPWKTYSVGQYKQDAIKVVNGIIARGKVPILVGGTGLYIWAMVDNLQIPEVPPNLELRKKLELKIKKQGLNFLWKQLIRLDPEAAKFVQKDNPRRVIRALEVILTTGKKFSDLRQKGKPLYNALQVGLKIPRQELYKKIDERVDQQIKDGLVEETKRLLKKICYSNVLKNIGITNIWDLSSTTSLGYRQIGMYLRGEALLEEVARILKRDTRRYARRQVTWFKRDKRIKWLSANKIILRTKKFLEEKLIK